ncbi:ATP-binding protein [Hymenobacter saemangeumensis]
MYNLTPWRQLAKPHADVLKGTFQQAEFAADLWQVHTGRASQDYRDPKAFFQRTFLTEGLRNLLMGTARRLAGQSGEPVIQLQTSFGGGKTHSMLAVYHLVGRDKGKAAVADLQGVGALLDEANVTVLPQARVAVLDGSALAPAGPTVHPDSPARTLWGELAWQLGGNEFYELVKAADEAGTSPGKAALIKLLEAAAPCVVLLDELVRYVSQFGEQRLVGGDLNSNLSFVQAVTEAVKAVPTAQLVVSLPDSDVEAGNAQAVASQRALEKVVGRVRALWKPAASDETFEIVRRRLFAEFGASEEIARVCRHYARHYADNPDFFPEEARHNTYYERLLAAYPLHPEILDRLYQDWSALEDFQRTRGVLKLLAQVIYQLWKDNDQDALIQPGNLPLQDQRVRSELLSHLPPGWEPVVVRDVDDRLAEPVGLDDKDQRFGAVRAATRVARTVFLGSAPNAGVARTGRGLGLSRVLLGAARPGHAPAVYADALQALTDRLHYLTHEGSRYWYDVRPNMRREMEDRRKRLDPHEVEEEIQKTLESLLREGRMFRSHVFPKPDGAEIPDDQNLRLVVLDINNPFQRSEPGRAHEAARHLLENRGTTPRQRRNRLFFLAADAADAGRLREQAGTVLAWRGIISDVQSGRLNSDVLQEKQLAGFRKDAEQKLLSGARDVFRWLLVPEAIDTTSPVQWVGTEKALNRSTLGTLAKEIEQRLSAEEWAIPEWSAKFLHQELRNVFWREDKPAVSVDEVWEAFCNYLYLPRLASRQVLEEAVRQGSGTTAAFGMAKAQPAAHEFTEASLGQQRSFGGSTLLVDPLVMKAYLDKAQANAQEPTNAGTTGTSQAATGGAQSTSWGTGHGSPTSEPTSGGAASNGGKQLNQPHTYSASVMLDPAGAKAQFSEILEEIVRELTGRVGVKVRLSLDIRAESEAGFDSNTARVLKDNSQRLKLDAHLE